MANGVDIGTLSGRIELEDNLSPGTVLIINRLDALEQKFGSVGKRAAESAVGFFTAEAAIEAVKFAAEKASEVLKDLTVDGAKAAGIEANFNRLTSSVGMLGSTLLGTLRSGTHATIDDLSLMKNVNQDLAAGMNLTDQQFGALAKGAYALSKATGVDVASALETMNDAMLTGNARSIRLLTGKIDLEAAEERFAARLGTTADHLTSEGKLEADRQAILEKVTGTTDRLGTQTEGLDDKVAQLSASWKNYKEELGKAIATSPAVLHAFDVIKTSLIEAFGGDSQDLIKTTVDWINELAVKVAEYVPSVVSFLKEAKTWLVDTWKAASEAVMDYGPVVWQGLIDAKGFVLDLYDSVMSTWDALPDWLKNVAEYSVLASIGLVAFQGAGKSVSDGVDQLLNIFGNVTSILFALPDVLTKGAAGMRALAAGTWSLNGALAIATIYVGALFAAYEIGKIQVISDFFQNIGLFVMGYSASERAAMIETDHLTQRMQEQSKSGHEQKDIVGQMKTAQDDLAAAMTHASETVKAHTAAVQDNGWIHSKSKDEIEKYNKAVRDVEEAEAAAGKGATDWSHIIAGMDQGLLTTIKNHLDLGLSVATLATRYEQVQPLIQAIAEAHKKETEAAKKQSEALAELNKLHNGYDSVLRSILPGVRRQVEAWLELHASLEKIKDATGLSDIQIQAIQKDMDAASASGNKLSGSLRGVGGSLDTAAGKALTLSEQLKAAREEMERMNAQPMSFDVTSDNLAQVAESFGIGSSFAEQKAKQGYSFAEIVAGANGAPHGPRIPGFKDGGMVNAGAGMDVRLHGKEIITPIDRVPGMGNTMNFYVNGYGEDVANQIASILMDRAKLGRQFRAA